MLTPSRLKQLEVASSEIIREIGSSLKLSWENNNHLVAECRGDITTEMDIKIENKLREKLFNLFPEAGFIVEEGQSSKKIIYNWIIDPIDQTKNYAHHLPLFFTQFALLENNIPILGHIYEPLSDHLFSASRGNGSTLNGHRLSAIFKDNPNEAMIDIDLGGADVYAKQNIEIVSKLFQKFYRLRVTGGAYSIFLLTGSVNVYIVLNNKTKYLDQAPRIILMREAGYKTEYIELDDRKILVASSPELFDIIENVIKSTKRI